MHILLTNDDGPPSALSSPYILPFTRALHNAGHVVSVIVPAEQRSWIGKAHLIGRDVAVEAYWPGRREGNLREGAEGEREEEVGKEDEVPWFLVDSTPASCAQIGLADGFWPAARGKIDLVISGPNYGNTTAVFALSSGTLGAALEAAISGYRAIALSFAFFDRNNDPAIVLETCTHAVRVCESLAAQPDSVDPWQGGNVLYSVNVPLQAGVSGKPVRWTKMLQNQWRKGACFTEILEPEGQEGLGREVEERDLRDREVEGKDGEADGQGKIAVDAAQVVKKEQWRRRHFKWAPRFTDVYESVQAAGPGSDGWAVKEGETSVTALRPNFMHVEGFEGEVKL